ncbi:uncharacterized protein JN550_004466 [Neoarthrinium moseri]|uniref:uncharacterized protein n=1 Tax=Neoarthrinium moseri TaxID=1658444 RepID=UPI001FDBE3A3|nr:uncharacterized protein JN550_004466 [Neoarthrinium moseri]KAI1871472.1 hypothetical protein JN550_004466 [Neoarthrinium moseri]
MITSELPTGLEEVDVIIVGGGTAGLIVAARLADTEPQSTILVIEGGSGNYRAPTIVHPALYRANFAQRNTSLMYVSVREENVADRSIVVAAGSVLGGGSSVNGAIYARAQQTDYDAWATKGWSTDELIPFLKKFENFNAQTRGDTHGYDGPTAVSDGRYSCPLLKDDFVSAVEQSGLPQVEDLQDLVSNNAVSAAHRYVSAETGERQNTALTYLHPRLQSGVTKNLIVLVQSQVTKILIDDTKRASGVEFRANPVFGSTTSSSLRTTIKSRRLVVVSAGTLGTPQILERSGIGGSDILTQAEIPVTADLPGVGNGYQDHHMVLGTYNSTLTPAQSVDSVINGALNTTELLATNANILSWNGVDASSKIRPSQEDVAGFKPQLRKVWDQSFANVPNKPLGSLVLVAGVLGDPTAYPKGHQYFTIGCYSPYPRSRGHVHITGPEMGDSLDFKTGFLSDEDGADVQTLAWLYKKQREVAMKMKFQLGPISPEPLFAKGLAVADGKIQYSPDDELANEQWVRENVNTAYHPMGTCKMGPIEEKGVVDSSLSVYGIKGLKVADMSIAPENVSANTMSTALLIGEKAADIFIKELGWGHA